MTDTATLETEEEVSDEMTGKTATGGGVSAPDLDAIRKTIIQAKTEDKSVLIERDVEIDLVYLSQLSRQHGIFAGVGGVAKSMTIDTAMSHLEDAKLFKVLLRKSMPVEEIFGPLSLKGLENDQFRYITDGRAADANVVFLDEIFKANAITLNAMLMLINERVFINDGVPIDLSDKLDSVFGASNELPTEPELHAFRDRFAWVKEVRPVATDDGFKAVLGGALGRTMKPSGPVTKIKRADMQAAQKAVEQITVPADVLNDIATMKRRAEGEFQLFISARRYISGIRMCQANAWLNGRQTVISDDLTLFQHTLWTDLEDAPKAYEVTLDYAGKVARITQQLRQSYEPYRNDLQTLKSEIPQDGAISQEVAGKVAAIQMNLKNVWTQVAKQVEEAKADGRDTSELEALQSEIDADRRYIREDILG